MKKRTLPIMLSIIFLGAALLVGACSKSTGSVPVHPTEGLIDVEGLGAVAFPNSGAPEAQEAFIRGVLLLHSFEYHRSAEAFSEAQAIDPDFALAYWGEAMTYNHPLWRQFDWESGRAALERLAPTRKERLAKAPTKREKLYMEAVETLFAFEGPVVNPATKELCGIPSGNARLDSLKPHRDRDYMEAMRRLHEAFPEDDEARSFYGLSVLGSRDGNREFGAYMQAGSIVLPVFERNRCHPGAAHYIIHSFDDPVHAPLALAAANAYSEIAPNAAHAQHMTSHIFVALGMWERTKTANIRATALSDADAIRRGKEPNVCAHYPNWLHYAYLQLGELEKAEALMELGQKHVEGEATVEEWDYYASMRARQILDLKDWEAVERWAVPLDRLPSDDGGWGYGFSYFKYRVTDALAALALGDSAAAKVLVAEPRPVVPGEALQIDMLAGLIAIQEGMADEGVALLQQAAAAEDALPLEFGPPEIVLPAFEVLGDALLKLGRTEEASAAFRRAAERTPRRATAIAGLEQAILGP